MKTLEKLQIIVEQYKNFKKGAPFLSVFIFLLTIYMGYLAFKGGSFHFGSGLLLLLSIFFLFVSIKLFFASKKNEPICQIAFLALKYGLDLFAIKKLLICLNNDKDNKNLKDLLTDLLKQNNLDFSYAYQIFFHQKLKNKDFEDKELEQKLIYHLNQMKQIENQEVELEKKTKNLNKDFEKNISDLQNRLNNLKQVQQKKLDYYYDIFKKVFKLKEKHYHLKKFAQEQKIIKNLHTTIQHLENQLLEKHLEEKYLQQFKGDLKAILKEEQSLIEFYQKNLDEVDTDKNLNLFKDEEI